jgi:hypothetical protein
MATKPTKDTSWAINDITDPGSSQPNKVEPPVAKKNDGHAFLDKPPFNWYNYMLNAFHLWRVYLETAIDEILGSTLTISGDKTFTGTNSHSGVNTFSNTTESTTKDNGAIITEGGIGVEKNLNVGGTIKNIDTTTSTSKDTGAIVTEGGLGVEENINAGGTIKNANTTESTTKDTGAVITEGGMGVEKNISLGGNFNHASNMTFWTGGTLAERFRITSIGQLTSNAESTPDCDPGGITYYLDSSDSTFITAKRNTVAHGMTTIAETDTAYVQEIASTNGGLTTIALSNIAVANELRNYANGEITTNATSAVGNYVVNCFVKNGTGKTSHATNANMMVIRNNDSTKHIFKGNGDIYTDSDQTAGLAGTFDIHNDIQLLKSINNKLGKKQSKLDKKVYKKAQELGIIDKKGFRSHEKSWRLNMGASLQLFNMIRKLAKQLNINEKTLFEYALDYDD